MRVALVLTVCLLLAGAALAQRFGGLSFQGHDDGPEATFPAKGEFHFIRVEYTDLPQYRRGFGFVSRNGRGNGWWMQDWPDADEHFSTGVQRLTRVETGQPLHMSLTDDKIFDNPWIYATQTGYWGLDNAEIARLREYLLRGGFLMVDDFWGPDPDQWEIFKETMQRVLPNKPISDIAAPDPVMHVLYDIEEKDRSFIPGTRHLRVRTRGKRGCTTAVRDQPRLARDVRRQEPPVCGGQLQHGHRRRLGIRRCARVPGTYDLTGVPVRNQLSGLRNDALTGRCR